LSICGRPDQPPIRQASISARDWTGRSGCARAGVPRAQIVAPASGLPVTYRPPTQPDRRGRQSHRLLRQVPVWPHDPLSLRMSPRDRPIHLRRWPGYHRPGQGDLPGDQCGRHGNCGMLTSYDEARHVSPEWRDEWVRRQASKGSNTKCACGSRWGQCSTLGADLDSLADRPFFGIALAVLGLSLRLRGSGIRWP
jgi:hypothetical protein